MSRLALVCILLAACVSPSVDTDGDGSPDLEDCAPEDPNVAPGHPEACDGLDTDCDGVRGDDEQDADRDGFIECAECDDEDTDRFPGALERCNGRDDDCDGELPLAEAFDVDGDGFIECNDCDDYADSVHPGAPEICDGNDNDCDGRMGPEETDDDRDGVPACRDCDDGNAAVLPNAYEVCDGLDNNCDGEVPIEEQDTDGDGAPDCVDCRPFDPDVHPGATERCNGIDDDCDGWFSEDDDDRDGVRWCAGDCDDTDSSTAPGAVEVCDGVDNDCDGAVPAVESDLDGDGESACQGDCDDGDASVYTGAPELCDGLVQDCWEPLPVDELDLDFDGVMPCAGDDDLLAPQASVTCDGAVLPTGLAGAAPALDALTPLEYAVAHATAEPADIEALILAIQAELDVVRGATGTVEFVGGAPGWTFLAPTPAECGGSILTWTPQEEHDFAIRFGASLPSAPALKGWYDAIYGYALPVVSWCAGALQLSEVTALQADCAQALDASGAIATSFSGSAARSYQYYGEPWLLAAWWDIPEAWNLDFAVGLSGAVPPLLPEGIAILNTSGSRYDLGVGAYINLMPTTIVTVTGTRSGTATLHPDTPWELSWATDIVASCTIEPVGTATAALHPAPGAPATSTATVTFDGDALCDGCGTVELDGAPAGDWCLGVGLVPP